MSKRKNNEREGSRAIAKAILEAYQPTTVQEMQDALRDIFGPMFEAMLQGEMDGHLDTKAMIEDRRQAQTAGTGIRTRQ